MANRAVEVSLFPEIRADRCVGPLVPSLIAGDNADLIAAVAPLYIAGDVLDVTYGRGMWWRRHRPENLQAHDIALDGVDFRKLPYDDRSWDTVCFDPPYIKSTGTIESSTAPSFRDRFGLDEKRTTAEVGELIVDGLTECARVMKRYLLVKCMDYSNGRQFHAVSYSTVAAAQQIGLYLHDEIILHAGPGPGGSHRILDQRRARRVHSKLLVFRWRRA